MTGIRSTRPGAGAGLRAARMAALTGLVLAAACRGGSAVPADPCRTFLCDQGGVIRADTSRPRMSLIFTGGSFADGGEPIRRVLREEGVAAGFFFTGDFYRTSEFAGVIRGLAEDGHYLGPHSDRHLLYCDWNDRAKTLVSRDDFRSDIEANFREMERFGIARAKGHLFIPPYEWHNDEIAAWSKEAGLVLFNFTPGTSSNADYTTPSMPEYLDSRTIYGRILAHERSDPHGLNGFILLIHIGTDPERTDKLYLRLADLIKELKSRGYDLVRIDRLLQVG